MYSRARRRYSLLTVLAFVICVALLALPNIPLLVFGAAQGQNGAPDPKGKPHLRPDETRLELGHQ